jgi:hypothetical protein
MRNASSSGQRSRVSKTGLIVDQDAGAGLDVLGQGELGAQVGAGFAPGGVVEALLQIAKEVGAVVSAQAGHVGRGGVLPENGSTRTLGGHPWPAF